MSLELEIACLNGDVLELLVDGSWTVDQLKEEIQKRTALEAIEQQLVMGTTVLASSDKSLQSLIEERASLVLLRRDPVLLKWLDWVGRGRAPYADTPEYLRGDRDLLYAALRKGRDRPVLRHADPELRNNREVLEFAVTRDGRSLQCAPAELQLEEALALAAVAGSRNPLPFDELHLDLRRNVEFCCKAVRQEGCLWHHLGAAMKVQRDVAISALQATANTNVLAGLPSELQADAEIVSLAVKKNGVMLQHAAQELRADKDIVFEAVSQSGRALRFAHPDFLSDAEIVHAAVKTHPCALKIAAEALRNDRRIVAAAVGGPSGSTALEYASEELKADTDLVLAAAKTHIAALEHAAAELLEDADFILDLAQWDIGAIGYASEALRCDRAFIARLISEMNLDRRHLLVDANADYVACLGLDLVSFWSVQDEVRASRADASWSSGTG